MPGSAKLIEQKNPELKGKLGYFPIPGKTAKNPGSVFTGGSDLIIPENAAERAPVSTWSRRSRARSGRRTSPGR